MSRTEDDLDAHTASILGEEERSKIYEKSKKLQVVEASQNNKNSALQATIIETDRTKPIAALHIYFIPGEKTMQHKVEFGFGPMRETKIPIVSKLYSVTLRDKPDEKMKDYDANLHGVGILRAQTESLPIVSRFICKSRGYGVIRPEYMFSSRNEKTKEPCSLKTVQDSELASKDVLDLAQAIENTVDLAFMAMPKHIKMQKFQELSQNRVHKR